MTHTDHYIHKFRACLTGNKIQEDKCRKINVQAYIFCYKVPEKYLLVKQDL